MKTRYILLILLLAGSIILPAQSPPSREYQLKAAFLFNFTRFVEWPAEAFPSEGTALVIGVLGHNPFGTYLEKIISGEKVDGHPVTVQYYTNPDEVGLCHILFINMANAKKDEEAVAALKERNILTVSDAPGFPKYGGMVRFFTSANKIKIQINLQAAKAADLVISSKLLRLAEIVNPK